MDTALIAGPETSRITFKSLDGLVALYHRPSAMTHIVTEPVPEIIAALGDSPLSFEQLMASLDVEDTREVRAALLARLDELEAGGLISRA